MDSSEELQQVRNHQPITLGEWMVTLLITVIPLVNIVMLFVWAFGENTKTSKANWAKAFLIWILISIILYIILFALFGAALMQSL